MQLHSLPNTTRKSLRRLGRGHGTGRGKTAGRGTKGQKARRNIPLRFEGGALPLIKRLPFRRGKNRNKSFIAKPVALNVSALNTLPAKTLVNLEVLIKHKIVNADEVKKVGVKILGGGNLEKILTVKLPTSQGAKAKIEKAGGSVEATSS